MITAGIGDGSEQSFKTAQDFMNILEEEKS